MRATVRNLAILAAVGLATYGIFQPVDREATWLLCLWAAAPLAGTAIWMSKPAIPRGLARSMYNLGLVVAIGFGMLSMQLLRQQAVQADAIYNYVGTDADGGSISNVRPVLASQRVLRGSIIDRKGVVLATSEKTGNFARRIYPLTARYTATAFGNVLGYFSTRFGASGLEATYGGYLSGGQGDPLGRLRQEWLGEDLRGNDLTLTLNADLQQAAAAALGGRTGSVVVLDPRTGEVLALVSQPGFDPGLLSFNTGAEDWDAENKRVSEYWGYLNSDAAGQPLIDRAVQGQYPPGSTYKTVTAIGALLYRGEGQPNNISCPDDYYPDPTAPAVVNAVRAGLEAIIRSTPSPGNPNLERVYAFSCNTAFAQYAVRLGPERMTEVAERFDIYPPRRVPDGYQGFTDLPTAPSRLFVETGYLNQPRALADTGYGQGQLLVTPLQMALVTAAIANDGVIMHPYLVQRVSRPDGSTVWEQAARPLKRAIPQDVAAEMLANMGAVGAYGFGRAVSDFVPGIPVGGKSGTAQHVEGAVPHAWFIAVAPLDEPRFAVAVMIESGGEGSSQGATLAGQVLQAAFATE